MLAPRKVCVASVARFRCGASRRWRVRPRPAAAIPRGAGARSHAAGRSGGPHRPAAERPALLHPQNGGRRSGCRCGWRSTPARSRRTTISAASRTSSSTWRSTARENFKPGELISFLESIGARFGPHVNAYTSFDETVYMLDVPTDSRATSIAACWRCTTSPAGMLAPAPRSREGARASSRSGAGGSAPARGSPTSSCRSLFQESRYAERLPIGTPEILKRPRRAAAVAFYRSGIAPIAWRWSWSATSTGGRSREADREALRRHPAAKGAAPAGRSPPCPRTRTRCSACRPIPRRRAGRCRSAFKGKAEQDDDGARLSPLAGRAAGARRC